jgi:hypothetical protein
MQALGPSCPLHIHRASSLRERTLNRASSSRSDHCGHIPSMSTRPRARAGGPRVFTLQISAIQGSSRAACSSTAVREVVDLDVDAQEVAKSVDGAR